MLKIRLTRTGRKNFPYFRVVLIEAHRSTKSKYLEILGSFNPRRKKGSLVLKEERIKHWLARGAGVSGTVHNILVKAGIVSGAKKKVTKVHKPKGEVKPDQKGAAK